MKPKLILLFIFLIGYSTLRSQNQLPQELKKVIPEKYKITYELYVNNSFLTDIKATLQFPAKYGCEKNTELNSPTEIHIGVYVITNQEFVKLQEEQLPFAQWLPTKESHKPQIDAWDESIEYSETTLVELEGGRAAYYTWTRKCIQSENPEYYGVALISLFGSHSTKIGISVNGNTDANEAISILKELHSILYKFDFQNL